MSARYFTIICVFAFLFNVLSSSAQQLQRFSVAEFVQDPLDLTARSGEYVRDGYAIIKVKADLPDDDLQAYRFDFGLMNSYVVHHPETAELWVYVQRNAKTVSITREGYAAVSKYDLRTTIEAGATYKMLILASAPIIHTQMVVFNVKPINAKAVIMVKREQDGAMEEFFGTTDQTGGVAKNLPWGTYTYKVAADNYYTTEGRFTLANQVENHVEDVTLQANFATVTLSVEAEAEIYVDGEKKGSRNWTGPLKAGSHQIECRQEKHRPITQAIYVAENETKSFSLTAPEPITGILSVTTRPLGASMFIDGKDYGKTPRNIDNLIIGRHTIELAYKGFEPVHDNFDIQEGQLTSLNIELSPINISNQEDTSQVRAIESNLNSDTPMNFNNDKMLLKDINSKAKKRARRLRIAGGSGGAILFGIGLVWALSDDFDTHDRLLLTGIFTASGIVWATPFLIGAHYVKKKSYLSISTVPVFQKELKMGNGTSLSAGLDLINDKNNHEHTMGLGLHYNF